MAALSAQTKGRKRRRTGAEGESDQTTHRFELVSPLVAAKDQKKRQEALNNLPPFWALLRGSLRCQPGHH